MRLLLLICAVVAVAGEARATLAADGLELRRSHRASDSDSVDFFLRGAQPGERIRYLVTVERTDEGTQFAIADPSSGNWVQADAAGGAYFQIPREIVPSGDERPFYVQAVAARDGGLVKSNFELLYDAPALFVLLESSGLVLRFDPRDGSLEDKGSVELGPNPLLVAAGDSAIVSNGGNLQSLDGGLISVLSPLEEKIGLAVTHDQSELMALTREILPDGKALLRVRLLDRTNPNLPSELGTIEVLRGARVVAAELVTGDDSHRVLIVSDNVIREIALGAEPARGLTLLPIAENGGEELVDVRVADDRLVAVTRARPSRARRSGENRLVIMDLVSRADPVERALSGRPGRFELVRSNGLLTAIVALDGGRIEAVSLDEPDVALPLLQVSGRVEFLARSPIPDRLYVLAVGAHLGRANVFELDANQLALTPVSLPPISGSIPWFGLVGAPDRHWLYLVEHFDLADDRLWCCEIDPGTGLPLPSESARSVLLGGRVLRVAGR